MLWSATMPDGRVLQVSTYGGAYLWTLCAGNGCAEVVGIRPDEYGARFRAALAWRDSTKKTIPKNILDQTKRAA
jgi:hypothetical protein